MIGKLIRLVLAPLGALVLGAGVAAAKVTIAVGGAGCLCYLPTVLAEQLGEFKKAGVEVELINFKGGSQALTAVIDGRVVTRGWTLSAWINASSIALPV